MSCFFCVYYDGLQCYCEKATLVSTGSESIDCDDYEYNQELKVE